MKIKLFFTISILSFFASKAQVVTTETFESFANASTTFTSNGQNFNIVSAGNLAYILNSSGLGWNGAATDNKFIMTNNDAVFSIKTADSKKFNALSFWASLLTGGSVTVKGKLSGATVFTAVANINDYNFYPSANGYALVDLATFGGTDNTAKSIDELEISTPGIDTFVDAFKWKSIPVLATSESQAKFLKIYPNPVQETLYIDSPEKQNVEIYNQNGQLLKSQTITNGENKLEVSNLKTGVYYLKTKKETKKFIKR